MRLIGIFTYFAPSYMISILCIAANRLLFVATRHQSSFSTVYDNGVLGGSLEHFFHSLTNACIRLKNKTKYGLIRRLFRNSITTSFNLYVNILLVPFVTQFFFIYARTLATTKRYLQREMIVTLTLPFVLLK